MYYKQRYYLTAFLLGFVWYFALSLPEATRQPLLELSAVNLPLICMTSLLVALLIRPLIASNKWLMILMAAAISPLLGSLIFSIGLALSLLVRTQLEGGIKWEFGEGYELLTLPIWILIGAVYYAYYIIFLMGLISVVLLKTLAFKDRQEKDI